MRYFGVGFKDWVEVRTARNPPREQKTQVSRMGLTPKPRTWNTVMDGPWNPVPSRYIIKTVAHIGGKVMTVVPALEFRKITKLNPPAHGQMIEVLDKTVVDELRVAGGKYN